MFCCMACKVPWPRLRHLTRMLRLSKLPELVTSSMQQFKTQSKSQSKVQYMNQTGEKHLNVHVSLYQFPAKSEPVKHTQ